MSFTSTTTYVPTRHRWFLADEDFWKRKIWEMHITLDTEEIGSVDKWRQPQLLLNGVVDSLESSYHQNIDRSKAWVFGDRGMTVRFGISYDMWSTLFFYMTIDELTTIMQYATSDCRLYVGHVLCLVHGPSGSGKTTRCEYLKKKVTSITNVARNGHTATNRQIRLHYQRTSAPIFISGKFGQFQKKIKED